MSKTPPKKKRVSHLVCNFHLKSPLAELSDIKNMDFLKRRLVNRLKRKQSREVRLFTFNQSYKDPKGLDERFDFIGKKKIYISAHGDYEYIGTRDLRALRLSPIDLAEVFVRYKLPKEEAFTINLQTCLSGKRPSNNRFDRSYAECFAAAMADRGYLNIEVRAYTCTIYMMPKHTMRRLTPENLTNTASSSSASSTPIADLLTQHIVCVRARNARISIHTGDVPEISF